MEKRRNVVWYFLLLCVIVFVLLSFGCKKFQNPHAPDLDPIINPDPPPDPVPLLVICSSSVSEAEEDEEIIFNAIVSGGTEPYSYLWDFGDGQSSVGQSVSHSYLVAGNYTPAVVVTDSAQTTASDSLSITISVAMYSVDFTLRIRAIDGRYVSATFELYIAERNAYIGDCSQFDLIDIIVYNKWDDIKKYWWTQDIPAGSWKVILRLASGNDAAFTNQWTFGQSMTTYDDVTLDWDEQHPWVYMSYVGRTMSLRFSVIKN